MIFIFHVLWVHENWNSHSHFWANTLWVNAGYAAKLISLGSLNFYFENIYPATLLQIEILIKNILAKKSWTYSQLFIYSFLVSYFLAEIVRIPLCYFSVVISALSPELLVMEIYEIFINKKHTETVCTLGTCQHAETWIDYHLTPARYMAEIMVSWDNWLSFEEPYQPPTLIDFLCSIPLSLEH